MSTPNQIQQISPRQYPLAAFWLPQVERTTLILLGVTTALGIYTALIVLYQKILDSVLDAWAKDLVRNQLVVEAGSLRWEFGCTMEPIPQSFLEEYFQSKRDAVARGFLPVYEREWAFNRTDRGRYCFAGMRVSERGDEVVPPNREDFASGIHG
ncbi:MAG: hypothetical protein Q9197_001316 [Variospora fuerteventurae]